MKTASGPHESLIESLINYIMLQYLNKQKEIKKTQLNYAQTVEKMDFFLIIIQFIVFDNCWGAAMDPLAGRVFEVPGLNDLFEKKIKLYFRQSVIRLSDPPLINYIWNNCKKKAKFTGFKMTFIS